MLTLTILNDNTPGRGFLAEHGLSFLIETKNESVLLDAGPGDVFIKNAAILKKDLSKVDYIVLSHGHWDHGNGLKFVSGQKLVAHPEVFKKRYHGNRANSYVGLEMNQTDMEQRFELKLSAQPLKLSENIWFLGEIPRLNDFESKSTAFVDADGQPDYIPDDSGIAITTPKGLIVISGCAHAGIINTINHAKLVTGETKVLAVLGGFHLKKNDKLTQQVINEMKMMDITYVYPSHCTDLPALTQFFNAFRVNQIRTGDVLQFK